MKLLVVKLVWQLQDVRFHLSVSKKGPFNSLSVVSPKLRGGNQLPDVRTLSEEPG